MSTHALKVGNKANSIGAHSLRMRELHGHKQPFPDNIAVSFRAFDRDWHLLHLELDATVWAPDSKAEFVDENGVVSLHQHSLNTYRSPFSSQGTGSDGEPDEMDGWAVVTLAEDGLITATLYTPQEIYQIDPVHVHANDVDPENPNWQELLDSAPHGIVMHKHSDSLSLKKDPLTGKVPATCGSVRPKADNPDESEIVHEEDVALPFTLNEGVEESSGAARKLLYAPGVKVTRWTGCYPGDTVRNKVSIGVATDVGYYKLLGSRQAVLNSIANIYASVSAVYLAQFNVYLEVSATFVMTATGTYSWNQQPPAGTTSRCNKLTTSQHLDRFTAWKRSAKPNNMALWSLLTNCWRGSGVAGLGYVGVVCSNDYGTSFSSHTSSTWLIVAHETGHNFGMNHAFQKGQGKTGGIMDYGNGQNTRRDTNDEQPKYMAPASAFLLHFSRPLSFCAVVVLALFLCPSFSFPFPGQYPLGSGIYQFHPTYNKPELCREMKAVVASAPSSPIKPYCFARYAPVRTGTGHKPHSIGTPFRHATVRSWGHCRFSSVGVCFVPCVFPVSLPLCVC
jgi:hypothetical protein